MPIENYSPLSGGAVAVIIRETTKALMTAGNRVTVLTRRSQDSEYSEGEVRHVLNIEEARGVVASVRNRIGQRINQWDWPHYGSYINSVIENLKSLGDPPDRIIVFNDFHAARVLKPHFPDSKILVWLQNEQPTCQQDLSRTFKATHKFLTCSSYIRTWTIDRYRVDPEQIVVAPSGCKYC